MSLNQHPSNCLTHVELGPDWEKIASPRISLLLEPRDLAGFEAEATNFMNGEPSSLIGHGNIAEAMAMLECIPAALANDIETLASRFSQVTNAARVRIRLECVTGNSCRKVHADRTDLRLITTYAGPGTQVLAGSDADGGEEFYNVPPGWIGLYKGSLFGAGHLPCLHRSPPAGDMGTKRLVLVIDTPGFAGGQWQNLRVA